MGTIIRHSSNQVCLLTDKHEAPKLFPTPFTISFLVASVYFATLTADYFWDGITFALQIEKVAKGERGVQLLFHQSHLLYNAFGYLLYCLARAVAPGTRALTVLQLANVLIGASAIGVLFQIAKRLTRSRYSAAVCSSGLAVSAVWWKLSTDADAYVLAVLLVLLCFRNLIGENPRWYIAGFMFAGAMLIHEIASLFSLAAVAAVFSNRNINQKTRFAAQMSIGAWVLVIAVYYLCAYRLHGITEPFGVIRWATSNPSLITPSLNPIPGILQSPRTNIDLIIGHSFSLFRATGGIIEWVAALAAVTAGLLMFFKAIKRTNLARLLMGLDKVRTEISGPHKKLYLVLALWIAPYLIFLCFFEPQDPYLRLLYAPALALALGLVVSNCLSIDRAQNKEALSFNGSSRVAVLAVATLAFFNLAFFIAPHLRTESNKTVARARDARKVWDEQTVIYFLNRNEVDTTFEYFNDQTKWRRLSRATLGMLENEVEYVHKRGGSVWINKGLAEALNAEWLARYARGGEIRLDVDYAPGRYLQLLPPE